MTKPKRDKTSGASPVSPTLEFTAESLHNFMEGKFNELEEKVATKACIENLLHRIDEQKQTINDMKDKIAVLESEITHLKKSNNDADQYQPRLCLRINEIELPPDGQMESREDCLKKVQKVFSELNVQKMSLIELTGLARW